MLKHQTARDYWEQLYGQEGYVYGTAPNQYMCAQAARLSPGAKVLATGDGEGRNGAWLAAQCLNVVAIDFSRNGIAKSESLARRMGVAMTHVCCDLNSWKWPREEFDMAAVIYLHLYIRERQFVHARLSDCLRPGGLLVLEAFHRRHAVKMGLKNGIIDSFYTSELLKQDFHGFDVLEISEQTMVLDEGPLHQGAAEIVRLTARKR
jgi:cyclopropane fatty-acyl-phospholipid synthase-like methyltransferase